MAPAKADLREWCRNRFGPDWHATDKAARLAEAAKALSEAAAPAAPPAASAAPPAASAAPPAASTAPPAAPTASDAPSAKAASKAPPASGPSASDLRAWCRQRFGNDWHSADKAARLAEARTALPSSSGSVAAPAPKPKAGSTKRPAPEAAAAQESKRAAPAAKEPTGSLADVLRENSNGMSFLALSRIVRAWNVLDFSGEMEFKLDGDSLAQVPVYYDTHDRTEMLSLMKEVMRTGQSSYTNPFGEDDTEGLLDAFGTLSADEQRRLHAVAARCVKAGAPLEFLGVGKMW